MVVAYSDNQPDYNWSFPYESKECTHYWYGIRDMGGVKAGGFTYNAEAYAAATGMLNLRARQYEQALGRFSQKDIVRGHITSPSTQNRYIF